MSDNRTAWADFWAAGSTGAGQSCMPCAAGRIDDSQRSLWQGFARSLRSGSRVLDIATGEGAVLKKIRESRRDLKLTGVDSAPDLPPPPAGIRIIKGVALEELPFADSSFDAVTSQFGYEYGDTRAAAPEVARVLKDGGAALFVLHKRDGPILAHNVSRREALHWALASGWLDKARAIAKARNMTPLPTPPAFRSAIEEAQRTFPQQPVAGEFLTAVLHTLELGRNRPAAESIETVDTLERKARNEIARIDSLERAACDAGRIEQISSELAGAGMTVDSPKVLIERETGRPFAWVLSSRRQARQ